MCPEMRHPGLSDLDAVVEASEEAWRLAERDVFPRQLGLMNDLPELTRTASSFAVEFRTQQDRFGPAGDQDPRPDSEGTMIALRFRPPDRPMSDAPWTVYVREWRPERADRLPDQGLLGTRKLRRMFSPKRSGDRPFPDWAMSTDIWITKELPKDDLTAQLVLFVVQTELSEDGAMFEWLFNYVRGHFKLPVKQQADRDDLVQGTVAHLLEHRWWPQDWRAWRKYVAACVRQKVREMSPVYASPGQPAPYDSRVCAVRDVDRADGVSG